MNRWPRQKWPGHPPNLPGEPRASAPALSGLRQSREGLRLPPPPHGGGTPESHTKDHIIWDFFAEKDGDAIAGQTVRALIYEVCTTPKPGLVDRVNNGSHKDMDVFTFMDSTAALVRLIAKVTDTNLIARGGSTGRKWAVKAATALKGPVPSHEELKELDQAFIERNLSPGGCADLLAITYFIYFCKEKRDDSDI